MTRYRGRAVAFVRPRRAEAHEDVYFPRMDEEGVVIRPLSVISRATEPDPHTRQTHSRGDSAQRCPPLPGNSPCGKVIEVGSKVRHLKAGDVAIGSNLFGGFDGCRALEYEDPADVETGTRECVAVVVAAASGSAS